MVRIRKLVRRFCFCTIMSWAGFLLIYHQDLFQLTYPVTRTTGLDTIKMYNRTKDLKLQYISMKEDKKKIIWYDVYNNGHGLRNKGRHVDFSLCQYKNCARLTDFIVNVTNIPTDHLKEADAVIFQGLHYPILKQPIPRRPGQIFVFAERESGWIIGCGNTSTADKYRNVFNWTMTFRRDSDIPMLYGDIISKSDTERKFFTKEATLVKRDTRDISFKAIFEDKTHDIVWLVSHCRTYSLREMYVAELQKHIPVDIIGGCGKRLCPKKGDKGCIEEIVKRYRFILSFENTFQTDYVTEKLYSWLPKNIIQVVFGLADYSKLVPRGTVINSAQFESPEHLAGYLKDVGSNMVKYTRYLRRKNMYFTVGHTEMQQVAYCKLCEMLHNVDSHRKSYPDLVAWWHVKNKSRINSFVSKEVAMIPDSCDEVR